MPIHQRLKFVQVCPESSATNNYGNDDKVDGECGGRRRGACPSLELHPILVFFFERDLIALVRPELAVAIVCSILEVGT